MKRRKKTPTADSESESDAESDLKIISLLSTGVDTSAVLEGGEVEEETEEALDKSFLSLDVEKERQITFAEIENANR
jgi:hypothetical protein